MKMVQLFIGAIALYLITGCTKMDTSKIEEELRSYDKKISLHLYSDRGLSYEKTDTLENIQFLNLVIHANDAFHNLSHNEKVKVLTDWKKEIDNQTLNTSFDCGDLTCSFDQGSVLVKDKKDIYSFSFKSAYTVMEKNDKHFEYIKSKEEEMSETFYFELNQKMEWFVLSLYNFKLRGYPFSYEEPYQKKKYFTRSFDEIVRYSDKIHELMVQTKQEKLIETSKRIQNYTRQYNEVYQPMRNKNKGEMDQLDILTYELAKELLVIAKAFPNPNMMDEKGKEFKDILTKDI